jgi:hypothetical protein
MSEAQTDDALLPLRDKEFKVVVYLLGTLNGYRLYPGATIKPNGYVRCIKNDEVTVSLFSDIKRVNPEFFETKQTPLRPYVVPSPSITNPKHIVPTANEPITISETVDISRLNLDKIIRISSEADIAKIKCEESLSPIYNYVTQIIAIGDIHGDLQSLLTILFSAKLIDNELQWIGGNTYLIFTGDLLDNYRDNKQMAQHPADEITIISFLSDLDFQARNQRGRVLLCLGNHELMNITNDHRYVSTSTKKYFNEILNGRQSQFTPGSRLLQKIGCLFETFVLINNKYFFCHAGLTPHFIDTIDTVYHSSMFNLKSKLISFNGDVKNIMKGTPTANHDLEWFETNFSGGMGHRYNIDSFFWTRNYDMNVGSKDSCNEFNAISNRLGLPELIMIKGHDTLVSMDTICNNRIFRIDTGISRSTQTEFSGNPSATDDNLLQSKNMSYLIINLTDPQNPRNTIVKIDSVENDIIRQKLIKFNQYSTPRQLLPFGLTPYKPKPKPIAVRTTFLGSPQSLMEMDQQQLAEYVTARANIASETNLREALEEAGIISLEYENWTDRSLNFHLGNVDYYQKHPDEKQAVIGVLLNMKAQAGDIIKSTPMLTPNVIRATPSIELARMAVARAAASIQSEACIGAISSKISGTDYKASWTREDLMIELPQEQYFIDNPHHLEPIIRALVDMRAEAESFTSFTKLSPGLIRATPPRNLAKMAVSRAAAALQSEACVQALSSKISGTDYNASWTRDDLMEELPQEPYFVANPHHLEPIIRALVAMRMEAITHSAPTRLTPDAIKSMSPNAIAVLATQRAHIPSDDTAGCIEAVTVLDFSGRTWKKDWQRQMLVLTFAKSAYFQAHPDHRDKIIDALVAMRMEALSLYKELITPETLMSMSSQQVAQEAVARAGIQPPDACVKALTGKVHGTTYSTVWTAGDLKETLEGLPYFVFSRDNLQPIIDALVGMREEADSSRDDIMLMKTQNADNFEMKKAELDKLYTEADANASIKTEVARIALAIANVTPAQQERILGINLYALIVRTHPTLAGKITAMFLKGFDNHEILDIIGSPRLRDEKIKLAFEQIKRFDSAGDAFKLEEFKP